MAIQWFPGHMHKARKEMAKVLPEVDVIIEVLDARIPWSSENPMLANIAGDKPLLRVLTKADLADPVRTEQWLVELRRHERHDAIAITAGDPAITKAIPQRLKALVPPPTSPRLKPYVAMVMGIPNVGKSTLINKLAGRVVAKTGNEPAITKRQQLITLSEHWRLRDTPGMLWPKVENEASGYRLAATGAVRDTAMDSSEVAAYLLDHLCVHYAEALRARYGKTLPLDESVQTLEAIGKMRGCLGGGGLIDFDRAGRLLLSEFRAGLLGGMTLETPAMRQKEEAETAKRLAEIAARREQRREKKSEERSARKARKKNS
ncbi:ribosome biogenesis GTPase YlqF [Granulosicoccus antarcticus]|uniref:Ribosome biogenesis GTPase A n=1 Tax=Granulosicoccus antarcticus IMCC3135 TaxID=1192854 RepID=A0A2Z2NV96_9GAMM|nr:ribosome biogenesis GTPase YlqF [Granulosicoccus antarcticus]ASJ75396.1 Ribosome biogenesis GTPase A [Granulosicoccus antarcticus IMCC3135]